MSQDFCCPVRVSKSLCFTCVMWSYCCLKSPMRSNRADFACKSQLIGVVCAMKLLTVYCDHNDGNYFADHNTLERLASENRIAFRYCLDDGSTDESKSPNGSQMAIAGILSESRKILGMMPHPERATDIEHGSTDGKTMFDALINELS